MSAHGEFQHKGGELHAEGVALTKVAERFGTPCYVYSRRALETRWRAFDNAFARRPHMVCYAVKANGNLAVLGVLAGLGSGFDIVSIGELERVLAAGGDASRVVFSGVGKRREEIHRALEAGIHSFNVESEQELECLDAVARECGVKAPLSLRINPDVDAKTHPYIATGLKENKFGIGFDNARRLFLRAARAPNLSVHGVDFHIGSQLTSIEPLVDATRRVISLIDDLAADGIELRYINIGGGLGVSYKEESPPSPQEYADAISDVVGDRNPQILLEPGRAVVAEAGVLLVRVSYLKHSGEKNFAIVDGAMNDFLRPALYQGWQEIVPVRPRPGTPERFDIVGPVCESSDFLGKDRELRVERDDLLAVRTAGAYGFCMSSNYNARPRAAEVMVDGNVAHQVRFRERVEDLFALERTLPAAVAPAIETSDIG